MGCLFSNELDEIKKGLAKCSKALQALKEGLITVTQTINDSLSMMDGKQKEAEARLQALKGEVYAKLNEVDTVLQQIQQNINDVEAKVGDVLAVKQRAEQLAAGAQEAASQAQAEAEAEAQRAQQEAEAEAARAEQEARDAAAAVENIDIPSVPNVGGLF